MASSRNSPGPHDRRVDPETGQLPPRPQCVKLTKTTGRRCKRDAIGHSKLCKSHKAQAEAELALAKQQKRTREPDEERKAANTARMAKNPVAQPTPDGIMRGGIATQVQKEAKTRALGSFVVKEQARNALQRLGNPNAKVLTDPRQTLLDTVSSAWRQQQVWEQMLALVPEEDWAFVGMIPVPGSQNSAKGARIEAIQKYLGEATKSAARISKLAIDAGIEERLVRLAEEQSAMIADTVKAGILAAMASLVRELRLSKTQQARVLDEALGSAATHLRLLAAGLSTENNTDQPAQGGSTPDSQSSPTSVSDAASEDMIIEGEFEREEEFQHA